MMRYNGAGKSSGRTQHVYSAQVKPNRIGFHTLPAYVKTFDQPLDNSSL